MLSYYAYVYEHHKNGLYITTVVIFLACESQNNLL